uniref:Dystroglycan n=1 Tax=Ackermannviridae sp. ctUml7 TaxID=2825753 RepID=A0A8S5V9S0_9CAUD|nr:MAG TPA: dystroglycan [Ackermannviridae sp. ctUml7]
MDSIISALLEIISFVIQILILVIVCILYVCFKKKRR